MDLHDLLTEDHRTPRLGAQNLVSIIDDQPEDVAPALAKFQGSVQRHFRKEDAYYRILDDDKRVSDRGLMHQMRNDHAAVIFTLESLAIRLRKSGVTPEWKSRFDTMMKVFLPHLDQEEKEVFPVGRKTLTAEETKQILKQIETNV